jgi:hypothetical protein
MKQKIIACLTIMTAMLGAALAVGPLGTIQFIDAKEFVYCYGFSGSEQPPICGLSKEDCKDAQKAGKDVNGDCFKVEGKPPAP